MTTSNGGFLTPRHKFLIDSSFVNECCGRGRHIEMSTLAALVVFIAVFVIGSHSQSQRVCVGTDYVCVVAYNNQIVCTGGVNTYGQLNLPKADNTTAFVAVTCQGYFACGLR